jgi:hypothetical protein
MDGVILTGSPARLEVAYEGSVLVSRLQFTLQEAGQARDISQYFLKDGRRLRASVPIQVGDYVLDVRGLDALGATLLSQVSFKVAGSRDLVVPIGGIELLPRVPEAHQLVEVIFQIENQGTEPTDDAFVDVMFEPDPDQDPEGPPPDAEVVPPRVPIPPLGPGERFVGQVTIIGLDRDGLVRVVADPDGQVPESDESNNSGQRPVRIGTQGWRDLAVRILSLDVEGVGKIRFNVEVLNQGTIDVQFPRLRYLIRSLDPDLDAPTDRDRVTLGAYQWFMGGEAGLCKGDIALTNPIEALDVLAAGDSRVIEYTAEWLPHTTFQGELNGATGWYWLCAEVVAHDEPNPQNPNTLKWAPILPEADRYGGSGATNADIFEWDVRGLASQPQSGELRLRRLSLDEPRASAAARKTYVSLKNVSYPEFTYAAVRLSWEAVGGREDGDTATAGWYSVVIGRGDFFVRVPTPGTRLPRSPLLNMTVEIATGEDGSGTIVVSESRIVPLTYTDIGIDAITLAPSGSFMHPVIQGGDPVVVTVHVRNLDTDPEEVTVSLQKRRDKCNEVPGPCNESSVFASLGSFTVTVPGDTVLPVSFNWSPPELARYQLRGQVSTQANQTIGTTGDEVADRFVTANPPPRIYPLAVEPAILAYQPNGTVTLRIKAYDANRTGDTFSLYVYNELEERFIVEDEAAGPIPVPSSSVAAAVDWLEYAWTPQQAGYHVLSIRVGGSGEENEEFRHRVDLVPRITQCGSVSRTIDDLSQEEYWGKTTLDGSALAWTKADAIIGGFDDAGIARARTACFYLDDGTTDPNDYLVTLRYDVDFSGIIYSADIELGYADAGYWTAVGFGVKESGSCWDHPDCFSWQKTLWQVDSDDGLGGALLGVEKDEVVKKLAEKAAEQVAKRVYRKIAKEATEEAVERVGKTVGKFAAAFVELGTFVFESVSCDHEVDYDKTVEVTVALTNLEQYDAFVLLESEEEANAVGGDAWAWVDFYDWFDPRLDPCAGGRGGVNLEFDSHTLAFIPRG